MSSLLAVAASDLAKRESARVVAATGLVFQRLTALATNRSIEQVANSRGGVWGDATAPGSGYPVLRSTNMRGQRVDVINPAWCDVSDQQAQACSLETGDILVTKSSGSSDLVGKAALFVHPCDGETYLFSNFTLRMRPDKRVILPKYLAWFLRSPQSLQWRYNAQQNAVGLRNLQTREFLQQSLPIPSREVQQAVVEYLDAVEAGDGQGEAVALPAEFCEQRRIVGRIEALAERIAEARGLRRAAMAETEALSRSALNEQFRRLELTFRPVRLDTISDCRLGKMLSQAAKSGAHSTPYLRNANVQWDRLDLSDVLEMDFDEEERKVFELHADDILVCEGGDIGKAAIWRNEIPGCCYQKALHRVRVIQDVAVPRFVLYHILWHAQQGHFDDVKTQTTIAHLTGVKLKASNVYIPSIPEQQRIVEYLDEVRTGVSTLKQANTEGATHLNALLPSVLDKAFRGEL